MILKMKTENQNPKMKTEGQKMSNRKLELVGTFVIPAHYMSYLVNGDFDNMTDLDEERISQFENELDHNCLTFQFEAEEKYFSHRNDIDPLGGDVYDVTIHGYQKSQIENENSWYQNSLNIFARNDYAFCQTIRNGIARWIIPSMGRVRAEHDAQCRDLSRIEIPENAEMVAITWVAEALLSEGSLRHEKTTSQIEAECEEKRNKGLEAYRAKTAQGLADVLRESGVSECDMDHYIECIESFDFKFRDIVLENIGFFEPNKSWSSQIETEIINRFYFIESQTQTTSDRVEHKYFNVIKVEQGYSLRNVERFGLFSDAFEFLTNMPESEFAICDKCNGSYKGASMLNRDCHICENGFAFEMEMGNESDDLRYRKAIGEI